MTAPDPWTTPGSHTPEEPREPLPDDHGPKLWMFLLALAVIAAIMILI